MSAFENLNVSSLRPGKGARLWADPNSGIGTLSKVLETWITEEGWAFSCQGIELSGEEMTAPDGLLPLLLHQAQDCLARALGSTAPHAVVHLESPTGLCGVAVDQVKGMTMGQWILAASFAMEEWVARHARKGGGPGPVPVDEWYEGWQKANDLGLVDIRRTPATPQPSQGISR